MNAKKSYALKNVVPVILISLLFTGFQSDTKIESKLTGIWVYHKAVTGGTSIYVRASKFDKDNAGIEFKNDSQLVMRQNAGWCGTPPINYGNFNGTWTMIGDTCIIMTYRVSWGGTMEQEDRIVSIDADTLVLRYKRSKEIERGK